MPSPRSYPRIRIARSGAQWVASVSLSASEDAPVEGSWESQAAAITAARASMDALIQPAPALTYDEGGQLPTGLTVVTNNSGSAIIVKPQYVHEIERDHVLAETASPKGLPAPVPTRCPTCKRRVRRFSERAAQWPGTVVMRDKHGHCSKCHLALQQELIDADAEALARDLTEATGTPPKVRRTRRVAPPEEPDVQPVPIALPSADVSAQAGAPATEQQPEAQPAPDDATDPAAALEPEPRRRGPAGTKRTAPAKPRPKRQRQPAPPPPDARPCADEGCDEPVRRKNRDLCNTHHDLARLAEPLTPSELQTRRGIDAFTAARRRRGIPPEGKQSA